MPSVIEGPGVIVASPVVTQLCSALPMGSANTTRTLFELCFK